MRIITQTLFVILSVIYPFIVYFGRDHLSPLILAVILLFILSLRIWMLGWRHSSAKLWLLIGITILALTALSNSIFALLWYPVAINLVFLCVFGYSLLYPPTIIERLARIREPILPSSAIHYTRRVTQIWCIFFMINGLIAAWTVFYSSAEIWAFYNGFIAYLLMGILFVGEWIVRYFYRRQYAK